MKLHEAISEVIESGNFNHKIRRSGWTHGDALIIRNEGGYMDGELYYEISGELSALCFVDDLMSDDWCVL